GTVNYAKSEGQFDSDRLGRARPVRIDALVAAVSAIATYEMDRPVHVAVSLSEDGPPHESVSSIGRELVFVFSQLSLLHRQVAAGADSARVAAAEPLERSPYAPTGLDAAPCAPSP